MNQDILKEVLYYEQLSLSTLLVVHTVAFILGAIHSLGPGHGKSLMAAYLVGSKGRIRDALILSLSLTLSHVFSVILIGLLALWLTDFFLPGKISRWMGLFSGIGIFIIGCWLLISRYKALNQKKLVNKLPFESDHLQNGKKITEHNSAPLSSLSQPRPSINHAENDNLDNHHHRHFQSNFSTWSNIALGISGGIVPCPKAIVILLLALSLHKITLGITIILAFSLGISIVLVALGIIMVKASHLLKGRFEGKAIRIIPLIGSLVIIGLGILMVIRTIMIF